MDNSLEYGIGAEPAPNEFMTLILCRITFSRHSYS